MGPAVRSEHLDGLGPSPIHSLESDRHLVSALGLLLVLVLLPESEYCCYPEDLEVLVLLLLAPSGAKPCFGRFAYWGSPKSWLLWMVLALPPQVSVTYFQT